jgi:RND superfamily putative drug exporter
LRDEFEIPGSDTQKATDLIEAKFASEQGGVLNVVFAAPEGERLDTPERRAAIEKAIARLKSQEFKPTDDEAGLESVGDPFSEDTVSDDGRIAYAEAQFSETIEDEDREAVVAVQDAVRETVEPAGVTVEYNGEAEFPPVEQGTSEALGLFAAIIVLLIVFRTFVAMLIPIALAISAPGDRVPPAVHPGRVDGHQHDHAHPRLQDRTGRGHRLLALHRHALQTAPA